MKYDRKLSVRDEAVVVVRNPFAWPNRIGKGIDFPALAEQKEAPLSMTLAHGTQFHLKYEKSKQELNSVPCFS